MRIQLEHTKKNWIWVGIALAFSLFIFIVASPSPWSFLFTVAMSYLIVMLKIEIDDKIKPIIAALCLIGSAVVTMFSVQYVILDWENFMKTSDIHLFVNVVIILAVYLIIMLICNRTALTCTIAHSALLIWGFVDYFVYQSRQNEFTFADIKATATGLSVAGGYKIRLHSRGAIAIYASMLLIALVWKLNVQFESRLQMSIITSLCTILCVVTVIFNSADVNTETWELKGSYRNGYFFNFVLSIRDSFVSAPEGYSLDAVEALEEEYETATDTLEESEVENPTIIVVMNESFADLSVLGEIQTNIEMTPFFDSLSENTLRGYALSSVFGAKTPNSEWEYMTGNTMAFLPTGSVVYQQYLQDEATSLVSTLKNRGYTCVAMHPYLSTGWSRNQVYPSLGFDEMYFIDDFPNQNIVREYIADEELYDQIIARFEAKAEGESLFMMNVTMQNHGGYATTYPNFTEEVYKIGRSYTDANQYFSLLNVSDQALEKLVTYFEDVDEPVEIVFFGDHQPSLSEGFYQILTGKGLSGLTLEETENYYKVPFFVWTNYDTQEETVDITSLNFLSSYTLERAGIELTPYERFLKDFREVIPAINSVAYYSKEIGGYRFIKDATGEEAEWIQKYKILQYNSMFDTDHRSEVFFPYIDDEE
ncbi:MAG: LTA synthase family protein [Lachnospiraceae bacterium]|nr:LTA synthase family protein [Lachnospiraceae bacterium]